MKLRNSSRSYEFDFLRALGILFMIMGHIWYGGIFEITIHMFHVQLFYLISGVLFSSEESGFIHYFLKKFKRLILPYLSFGLFHLMIKSVFAIVSKKSILPFFKQLFWVNNGDFPIAGALWFLTSLFFVYLLYYWINRIHNQLVRDFFVLFLVIFGYVISSYVVLPFSINSSLVCVGFFHIGYRLKNIIKKYNSINFFSILLLIFGFLFGFFNGGVNVREGVYGNLLYFYLSSCFINYFLYCFSCLYLKKLLPSKEMLFIGRESLIYMSFNQLLVWIPNHLISSMTGFIVCILKTITFILTLVLLHFFASFINKSSLLKKISGKG